MPRSPKRVQERVRSCVDSDSGASGVPQRRRPWNTLSDSFRTLPGFSRSDPCARLGGSQRNQHYLAICHPISCATPGIAAHPNTHTHTHTNWVGHLRCEGVAERNCGNYRSGFYHCSGWQLFSKMRCGNWTSSRWLNCEFGGGSQVQKKSVSMRKLMLRELNSKIVLIRVLCSDSQGESLCGEKQR